VKGTELFHKLRKAWMKEEKEKWKRQKNVEGKKQ
jgi:hypothetical protein